MLGNDIEGILSAMIGPAGWGPMVVLGDRSPGKASQLCTCKGETNLQASRKKHDCKVKETPPRWVITPQRVEIIIYVLI